MSNVDSFESTAKEKVFGGNVIAALNIGYIDLSISKEMHV